MVGRRYFRILLALTAAIVLVVLIATSSDSLVKSWTPSRESLTVSNLFAPKKGEKDGSTTVKQTVSEEVTTDIDSIAPGPVDNGDEGFPLGKEYRSNVIFSASPLKTFTDPHTLIDGKPADYTFSEESMCNSLQYERSLTYSQQSFLNADYTTLQAALASNEGFSQILAEANRKFKPKIPAEKQWHRFAGSSVWLPQYGLHFMVSRVMWSPSGIPNKAFASFLYAQLFDRNWEEVPETHLKVPYEEKVTKSVINADGTKSELTLDTTKSFRNIKFPSFLPISFDYHMHVDSGKYYWGPEDPRIIGRTNSQGEVEPIIVFNMKNHKLEKRVMHSYKPFSDDLQILKRRSGKFGYIEKNWTPFFGRQCQNEDKINFVSSMDPLEVMACSLEDGICDPLYENTKTPGPLRGGTQLMELPIDDQIPDHVRNLYKLPDNRKVFVGWARTHLKECGCGESMYRPNLIVFVEDYNPDTKKYYYKVTDVSEYFDFDITAPEWYMPKIASDGTLIEPEPKQCVGRSVLIPNSIAYWGISAILKNNVLYRRQFYSVIPTDEEIADKNAGKVMKQEYKREAIPVEFEDYMGITLSGGDMDVSIVHVKGLLDYILNIPSLFDKATVITSDEKFQQRGFDYNNICAAKASHQYCVRFAEAHGGVTEYKKKD